MSVFFVQAEDGIRDLVRSRGLGDVYKRQYQYRAFKTANLTRTAMVYVGANDGMLHAFNASSGEEVWAYVPTCLLYTSDAADERSSVDLGGRRIIKKKKTNNTKVGRSNEDDHRR